MKSSLKKKITRTVRIVRSNISYKLFIGSDLLGDLSHYHNFNIYSQIVIITDELVAHHWLHKLKKGVKCDTIDIILPSGEIHKNIRTVTKIWSELLEHHCDRKMLIINLGGGVVGDIGGFVASTYKRGVAFMHIPTTLLAQVDASIGGKVGINYGGVKNSIGNFAQPQAVFIDVNTLKTLPRRNFVASFSEVIKHGLITDKHYLKKVTVKKPFQFSKQELIDIISGSCKIKAHVVEKDEQECEARKILNFGHTIGHALESLSFKTSAKLLHGEAISIGIVAESRISFLLGMISEKQLVQIEKCLQNAGLPVRAKRVSVTSVIKKIMNDKKVEHGKVVWVLLGDIGNALITTDVSDNFVKQAIEYITP